MPRSSILSLFVEIHANSVQFNKGIKQSQDTLKSFVSNFERAAAAVGIGFGVQQIGQFTIEMAKLAGQSEAVRTAFERLPQATKLMVELKQATANTVSEFDLMKAAVKASNFNIELSQLPKLLQFATLRAQQTGQSVDYLVESIIMGIGRKSPMILDNLGISLVRLREKLKGVGAESASVAQMTQVVGEIATEELGNMAGFASNAATKIDQIAAAYTNLKISIGNNFQQSNHYNSLLENIKNQLIVWNSSEVTWWTKLFSSAKEYQQIVADIEAKQRAAAGERGPGPTPFEEFQKKQINQLKSLGEYMKAALTPSEEELDKQKKALDKAASEWEKYFQKIQDLDKKTSVPEFTLLKELKIVGLGQLSKKEEPLEKLNIESIENLKVGTSEWLRSYVEGIKVFVNQTKVAKGAINELRESGSNAMEEFVRSSIANLAELGGMLAVGNIKFKDFGRAFIEAVADFMKLFGQQLIEIGTAKLALDDLFKGVTGGIGAIIAGVALIAASGAIKGSINNKLKREQELALMSKNGGISGTRQTGNNIEITGTLVGNGRDLIAVINNTNFDNKYRRGG